MASWSDGTTLEFVWVEPGAPARGGQWMALPPHGDAHPVVLADAVAAHRRRGGREDPLTVHVDATRTAIAAAGDLEDELFPTVAVRYERALVAADVGEPEVDPSSPEGARVRSAAEALEKLAADLAELVEEQLDGGSLAELPPDSTLALCQATQAAWRLRRLIDPPGPLYL